MQFVCIVLTALFCCSPLAAEGGEETPAENTEGSSIQVVTLAHANAECVQRAIHELGFKNVRSTVATDNRVVLRGEPADIQVVLKEVVGKLDVPAVEGSQSTVDYIQLSQRPPGSFEALLEAVAPREFGTYYAIDPVSRLIAVNAPKEKVAAVHRLVEIMDRPTESYFIHFYFLRGRIGGGAVEKSGEALPRDVASVVGALQAAGFGELSLVAPLVIQGVDGASFQSKVPQVRDWSEEGDELGFLVHGKPFADGTGSVVQLELDVQLTGRAVQKRESGTVVTYPTLLAAESMIAVKLDQCVVLAAAPTAGTDGGAFAVAVKVTRASTGKP